jgi:diguanylate cyclase (GGDEF)-like protein/PAS domain S-box-containing protein
MNGRLLPDHNARAALSWWVMVVAGFLALFAAALQVAHLPRAAVGQVLVGCLMAMVAGLFPVRFSRATRSFAAGEIFIFLLLLLHGPGAATLGAAAQGLVGSARSHRRWTRRAARPAVAAITMSLLGPALHGGLGALKSMSMLNEIVLLIGSVAFAIAYFLISTLLAGLVRHFTRNESLTRKAMFAGAGWAVATYTGSALIGALLFLTFEQIGTAVLVAAIPTITMLLSTLHHYLRRREATDAARLQCVDTAQREVAIAAQHAVAMANSERRFHSAFSHAAIGMALVSPNGKVQQANAALCGLLGHSESEVLGRPFSDFAHPEDVGSLSQRLLDVANRSSEDAAVELRCRHARGHEVWVAVHSSHFSELDSSEPCLILQAQDVTARRAAETLLQHVAYHDSLTTLVNRARFGQCLARAIERCSADPDHTFAVMYLDFDRFKLINDTLGHSAGDRFLVMVAQRIQRQVRPTDTVGRLGGDEFAILVEDIQDKLVAVNMAERLQEALREPYLVSGTEINSSASIGITFSAIGYATPDEVLRDADIAMYRAKSAGRARYALFDAALRSQLSDQVQLEADLRRAIEQNQLSVAYQPIYDLQTGQVMSFEALARWDHPRRGFIAPRVFIPIAEESGLIAALTKSVLSIACRQLGVWQHDGVGHSSLQIQVNLSGLDLCHGGLAIHVEKTLHANGLAASRLTLEITESTLMTSLDRVMDTMMKLRDIGVGLSVDDFGTGYSSLSYLSTLPITGLKIDRSFVSRLTHGSQDCEIAKAIITLGNVLGKSVVAEGIETTAQMEQLRALGCGFGQGYLLGRPMHAGAARKLLESAVRLPTR